MADLTLTVAYFGILLGLGVILTSILKKRGIPDTFFLLLLGLVLGPTLYLNPYVMYYVNVVLVDVSKMGTVPDFLRLLALIFVVFTGTLNLGFKAFKRFSNMAVNLALIGVVFNTVVLGTVAHFMFGLEVVYSFLMAAVISGTCSSVMFAFEGVLKGSKKAMNILKVESIFNYPLSVLLPIIFLDFVAIESGALLDPMKYLSQFWLMIVAGVGTGLILGIGISKMLRSVIKGYTALLLFATALITYSLAETVGGSGMLAVAIAGLIAGDFAIPGARDVRLFDDHLSELLRISVFTLLGAQVALFMSPGDLLMAFLFFLVAFFIRPVFLIPILGKKRKDFDRRDFAMLSFVTPRGLSAAAMAPIVAASLLAAGQPAAIATKMVNIIFIVIMLSILFSSLVAGFLSRTRPAKAKSTKEQRILSSAEKDTEKKKEDDILTKAEKETEDSKSKTNREMLEDLEREALEKKKQRARKSGPAQGT
jgi:cell volume regulation protein A